MHCAAAAGLHAIMVANPRHDVADAQTSIMVTDLAAAVDYLLGRAQTSLNPAARRHRRKPIESEHCGDIERRAFSGQFANFAELQQTGTAG
jgi:hypothetical protein